jgi:hypothetical protein
VFHSPILSTYFGLRVVGMRGSVVYSNELCVRESEENKIVLSLPMNVAPFGMVNIE